ncbi:vitamin k epoxide reductase family protein [Toxoplasma gondii ME49]|uniref:vitamin-K-epoxide reductase (warfarin-sensitive) n=6 Tax=Toxoplasma gondii TaxID=5811 RepID=B9QCW6_TOXGV|nr:vitamin k epoxide reductase family protein [Toxoplasma gondii ME49]ESS34383.1 vitamin k epoxide reductase family protein [Toxoplasma gondii VEG]KFH03705.1 vitamin k epoxide reductase family protein [Toxoplasma gondii MAS]KFH11925.1 vitamin k epoxide reductase family protein [Toxoplasma gondii VAND]KYF50085.1 vitamin k epoxide reductase family protein [Toxoplasma gondii ARI]PIM04422.1 vitamin k epoxide reductase family protein [Toxoplasma gondii COUG]|eukprot:XP_018635052.1 vitamin k epoxide reductase family protein [Toxoplasma gondii ME49]
MAGVDRSVVVTAALGVALCMYAIHVEHSASLDASYRAVCDFSASASCSKVLTSPQSRLLKYFGVAAPGSHFDFPNTYLGLVFYASMLTFPLGRHSCPSFYTLSAAASMATSIYLAYVLYAVLEDFCVVCVSSYVLNLILFGAALFSQAESRKATRVGRRGPAEKKAKRT